MRIVGSTGVAAATAALVICLCCWMIAAELPLANGNAPAGPTRSTAAAQIVTEITRGFTASPTLTPPPAFPASSSSSVHFQSLLSDPSGTFSFGFLLMPMAQLHLAVIHVPSSLPLWTARANNNVFPPWNPSTTLSFDGRLLLQDTTSGTLFWSAGVDAQVGSTLVLRNTSNLQIIIRNKKMESAAIVILWQSFDSPSDTIVQDQNFTSAAQLGSANSRFSMRLGPNYLGLYFNYNHNHIVMYWKQTALQARAEIVQGKGPIYARINASDGFLGMYQEEGPPADVMSFDSFNRHVSAALFRRLTLESDGNLKGYYWNGSFWVPDFQAISDMCSLPTSCGAYALCHRNGSAGSCSCLDSSSAESLPPKCLPEDKGDDLCSSNSNSSNNNKYWVLRTADVDLAYKEYIGFSKMSSLEECEGSCERNCSCWGAIYSNSSGYCYTMDFPIETLVEVGGQGGKMGYFKVRSSSKNKQGNNTTRALRVVGVVSATLLVVGLLTTAFIFLAYNKWRSSYNRRSMTQRSMLDEGLSPVPYRDLKNAPSFRSDIELSVSSTASSSVKQVQAIT